MTASPFAPKLLVDGAPAEASPFITLLSISGWVIKRGFGQDESPWSLDGSVCTGVVETPDEASRALLAAARGAGLVLVVARSTNLLEDFFDDLSRIGAVESWPKPAPDPLARISALQVCLLHLLSQGDSVAEAAARLHLSRRSADRQFAAVRSAFGVATTTEAVVYFTQVIPRSLPSWGNWLAGPATQPGERSLAGR